jgi:4-amino-4-deoxy-L-arabinose transferase-like glycosyltransferase
MSSNKQESGPPQHAFPTRRWSAASIAGLVAAWLVLQVGGLFSPGLLDDVDSIYIQIAREMLQRHDFVTPTIDGIRFFDKPPLMYWMAAASMRVFGIHDWAARLPLALGVLALLFAVYALGIRLFAAISSAEFPDRGGLYAALAMATSIGPYLYTRFYIPDILIALWMTLSIHLFLIALDRATNPSDPSTGPGGPSFASFAKGGVSGEARPLSSTSHKSPLLPMLGFGVILALSVLTKGLIGIVFPIAFVILYLAISKKLRALLKLHLPAATGAFLLIAAPWHILAALRNPAIPMPAGVGLPAKAGWAWFYLYNEHVARFLSRRIPHDYGQTPIWLFWLLAVLWMMPWAAFLPTAIGQFFPQIRRKSEAALTLFLWAALVLGFFTLSARQEYYSLPALPALALLVGGTLAWADAHRDSATNRSILRWSLWLLVPITTVVAAACGYFALTAPAPAPGTDLNHLLSSNPEMYNLSLGHVFDLTSEAMGFFRGPLLTVAICMAALGPGSHLFRRRGRTVIANIALAGAMCGVLLAAHEGLARFYPILGSKDLALAIDHARQPGDLILLDGELTSGSTLLFYTGQPVHLVNGRVNGPWFGSFWPDAPPIFEDEASLRRLWSSPQRIFLLTYDPVKRTTDLAAQGHVITLASSGGKTVLTNQP